MVLRARKFSKKPAIDRLVVSPDERDLVTRTLATLGELGITASVDAKLPPTKAADYLGSLRRGPKRASYHIEVRRTLRPAALGPVLLRLAKLKPSALLLAEYITPQMAQLLRDHNIAFADTAGNAYLKLAGDIFYVVGNVPERKPRSEKVVRAFQPAGLRVVFALLCQPELVSLPTRELAHRLQVANGTVSRVLDDLGHLGFLTTAGRRDRRLRNQRGLLERWAMMYPAQLRPSLLRRRLSTEVAHWWQAEQFSPPHVVLGGEAAADRLTGSLKPGSITLYARGQAKPLNRIVAQHHLKTEATGNVEVLEAFWPADIPVEKAGLAPTILIYADLLSNGDDRCLEVARKVYDEHLTGRFKPA